MSLEDPNPSFTPYRKWGIGFNVALLVLVVLAVVVMLNYLSHDYFLRLHLSTNNKINLSPRTQRFLQGMTNQVKVTVYYDKEDPFYGTIIDLLKEYRLRNSRISFQTVDYKRDPGAAQQLKAKYSVLSGPNTKNVVIFDCDRGAVKAIDGNALTKFIYEQLPNPEQREFRLKPVTFEGEKAFTTMLLAVTSPNPLKALFLRGHGEHELQSKDDNLGYMNFVKLLNENYIQADYVSLLGTNTLSPTNCDVLVVAGPTAPLTDFELEKVEQYLNEGGRMFALFNCLGSKETGLEKVLAKWGIAVSTNIVVDPENNSGAQTDVHVSSFSGTHPVVNPLLGLRLQLILPRWVSKARAGQQQPVNAPQVDEIAFSGPQSFLKSTPAEHKPFPLMVAVEKGGIKGVVTERGTTRILVVGDSIFLANHQIYSAANSEFLSYAMNWLVDRPQLLQDVGPVVVKEYRLLMSRAQLQTAEWVLLGGMPGTALLIGTLVWFRRRK